MIDDKTLEALEKRARECVVCRSGDCAGCGKGLSSEEALTIIVELKEAQQRFEKMRGKERELTAKIQRWKNMTAADFGEMLGGI